MLKSDRRKVADLFVQNEAAEDDRIEKESAAQICMKLKIHAMIEEEIFYPALEGKIMAVTIDEAYVEHDGAKVLINDSAAGTPTGEYYDVKVKVLSEQIKHLVREEEMSDIGMFDQAHASCLDFVELGAALKARKQELAIESMGNGFPPAKPAVVNWATM